MSDENKHRVSIPYEELHQGPGGGGGKGCLVRHEQRKTGNQCSHQWTAQVRAEGEDAGLYNYPAYKSLCDEGPDFLTGAYETKKKGIFPPGSGLTQTRPKVGEWNVGVGQNFAHFLRPWWHNAHHLVPNRTLSTAINEAGKDDARISELIFIGLLMGEYNLNDKKNMMILPMGAVVADALGLPRHIHGDAGGKKEFFNHPDYNARVKNMLTPVIDRYKAMVKSKLKDHPDPPDKLSKDSLVSISDTIHTAIKTLRRRKKLGRSLDSAFGTG